MKRAKVNKTVKKSTSQQSAPVVKPQASRIPPGIGDLSDSPSHKRSCAMTADTNAARRKRLRESKREAEQLMADNPRLSCALFLIEQAQRELTGRDYD